ncbi:MAG: hypothetical protein FGF52_05180 [Candidatus Brockarchaeota archaeon]|nr:hypothetical protein [Candidatus Brockarchaeota archaeon]
MSNAAYLISTKSYQRFGRDQVKRARNLCIDTGASSTIILDRDIRYLRLKIKDLKRTERSVGGIGGLIDTYLLEDVTMLFKTEEGMLHEEKLALLVGVH